jgi:hypothetical protein
MTNIKDKKSALVVVIITVLAVSTVAIGNEHAANAFGRGTSPPPGLTVTNDLSNSGVNVQTDTNQKQSCEIAGASSPIGSGTTMGSASMGAGAGKISPACVSTSTDQVSQSGGELQR